jgi:hypothetical protein
VYFLPDSFMLHLCFSVKGIWVQLRVLLALQWLTYSPRASVWTNQLLFSFV